MFANLGEASDDVSVEFEDVREVCAIVESSRHVVLLHQIHLFDAFHAKRLVSVHQYFVHLRRDTVVKEKNGWEEVRSKRHRDVEVAMDVRVKKGKI